MKKAPFTISVIVVLVCAILAVSWLYPSVQRWSQHLTGAVIYPDGWPIAQLVAPPGSTRVAYFKGQISKYNGCAQCWDYGDRQEYISIFKTKLSNAEVIKYFNEIMKPMNYHYRDGGYPVRPWCDWSYYSPDGKLVVEIMSVNILTSVSTDKWKMKIQAYQLPDTANLATYAASPPIP